MPEARFGIYVGGGMASFILAACPSRAIGKPKGTLSIIKMVKFGFLYRPISCFDVTCF